MIKSPLKQALRALPAAATPGNCCQGGRIFRYRAGNAIDLCRCRAMIRETALGGPVDGL
jgi:hypothetical protein